jgi:hypothetical protein
MINAHILYVKVFLSAHTHNRQAVFGPSRYELDQEGVLGIFRLKKT